jgi:hypothetical protein
MIILSGQAKVSWKSGFFRAASATEDDSIRLLKAGSSIAPFVRCTGFFYA